MVGEQPCPCQRAPDSDFPTASSNSIRCLQHRMGRCKQWGRYQGKWTREETSLHIDCKELLAASFAGRAFTKSLHNIHVLIEMDNTTTIAYINKIGRREGDKRCLLDHYARHLCSWCVQKRITLRAEHIPGCVNTITDRESRDKLDSSHWYLNPKYFQLIITKLGQSTIDLFASRTNHQLPSFVRNYKPDPEAEAIDPLTQPWAREAG